MENQTQEKIDKYKYMLPVSIFISAMIFSGALVYSSLNNSNKSPAVKNQNISEKNAGNYTANLEEVISSNSVVLPVTWGNLGSKLVDAGAIDYERFKSLYEQRSQFTKEYEDLLTGNNKGNLKITEKNSGYLLNLLWALGLANKNPILDLGEMTNKAYGGAGNFASTGGWTMAKGDAMNHYSRHEFFSLTQEQQALVDKVSKNIYRPCCNNSTHFPDCNHGMAMLGLLELMASQGVSEQNMYKAALAVNSYWFPDNYITIAAYMKDKGVEWKDVNPKEILGINYSSGSGYAKISSQVVQSQEQRGGSGCGVDAGESVTPQRQQGGCGI